MIEILYISLFTISAAIAHIFWDLVAGKYEGDKINRSLRFRLGNYWIHIHHWLYSAIILLVLLTLGLFNPILIGLSAGSIIQGLRYKDRFIICYHRKNFEKIYGRFKNLK